MNEKELYLKCLQHFNRNKNNFSTLRQIFTDLKETNEKSKLESLLRTSGLIEESVTGKTYGLYFKLADRVYAELLRKSPEEYIESHFQNEVEKYEIKTFK